MNQQTAGAVRCPVCGGNGLVPSGFYTKTGDTWAVYTTGPETCRSCDGKGYLLLATQAEIEQVRAMEEALRAALTTMEECEGTFATYLYPNHPGSENWDAPTLCRRNMLVARAALGQSK